MTEKKETRHSNKDAPGVVPVQLSTGKWYFKPISEATQKMIRAKVRKEFIKEGRQINPPTYEVTLFGNVTASEPHDHTTEKNSAEKKIWNDHLFALNELGIEQNNRVNKAVLMGLQVNLPEDEKWIERQEFIGVDVPREEGEYILLYHYITTEVVVTANDFISITQAYSEALLGGIVDKETLDELIAGFRNSAGTALTPKPEATEE